MRYSIIVPVLNSEEYITECIESILRQRTENDYELLLFDDGSTDSTGCICDRFAQENKAIRVIHQPNLGPSRTRNRGIETARGDYILFLDADDCWKERLLAALDVLLASNPDMAVFGFEFFGEAEEETRFLLPYVPVRETGMAYMNMLFDMGCVPMAYSWCYVYRRLFLEKEGLRFSPDMCTSEDFDFNMRALPSAQSIVGTREILYRYRQRADSLSRTVSLESVEANLQSKAKWYRRYPNLPMAELYISQLLLIAGLQDPAEIRAIKKQIRADWDIVRQPKRMVIRVRRLMLSVFGCYRGAKLFRALMRLRNRLAG